MHRWCMVLIGAIVVVAVADLSSAAAVFIENQVTAGRETPLAWPPCLTEGRRRRSADGDGFEYAVVVDAGSSGSRARVYRWPTPTGIVRVALQAPGVEEINSTKIRGGLSSHSTDLQGARDHIHILLSNAAKHVPGPLQRYSPVYVMATAGMRLLLEDRMNTMMRYIDSLMRNSSFQPFLYTSEHSTRILSGEEEGVFAWIAVNYLLGVFSNDVYSHDELVGVLEMGGASTQIAFAPKGDILAAKFPVLIGGHRYPLYVHSYLRWGQNAFDARVKALLAADAEESTSQPVVHPCMMRGDTVSDDTLQRTFTGSGDPPGCVRLLNRIIHKAEPSQCFPKPCGIGVFYQPTIDANITFYAAGAFWYPLRDIGALMEDGLFIPKTGFEKAAEFCTKNFDDVVPQNASAKTRRHASMRCLIALYSVVLMTRGYGFDNDTQQIRVVKEIHGQPVEWSLGAMLYEDELAAINSCELVPQAAQLSSSSSDIVNSTFLCTISISLLYLFQNIRRL